VADACSARRDSVLQPMQARLADGTPVTLPKLAVFFMPP
jgi:hypothetical protein